MSILSYTRNKNKGLVLHEWDYEIKDNKINYMSDLDKITLDAKTKHVEKVWLRANQKNPTIGNLTVVNYFFNNYTVNRNTHPYHKSEKADSLNNHQPHIHIAAIHHSCHQVAIVLSAYFHLLRIPNTVHYP